MFKYVQTLLQKLRERVREHIYHVVDIQTFFIRTLDQAAPALCTLYETTQNQVDHDNHCRQVGRRASN